MSQISQSVNAHPQTVGIIVGRDLVGDALIKLSFLRAVRNAYPNGEIHWITAQGPTAYGGVLRDATQALIDKIDDQPQWLSTTRHRATEKPPHFDVLIDTRNRWKEARLAKKIPHEIFIAPAMRYLFSDKRPSLLTPKFPHVCDRLMQMLTLAAGHTPSSKGALPVPDDIMAVARKLLPPGKTYVGLAPGAGGKMKIWPRYKFEKVAALQASKGRVPVFILGPQEMAAFDALQAAVPEALFPLQAYEVLGTIQPKLDHTLAVASLLDIAVANDSGVGHMLAAVDCPLISLFGPTSAAKLAPRVSRGRVIRAQTFGTAQMKSITWEAVDSAIDEMLRHS